MYKSNFSPSPQAATILLQGKIRSPKESPAQMVERVVSEVISIEKKFKVSKENQKKFANKIGGLIDDKVIIPSTPILTNAGRYKEKTLSACFVPTIDLREDFKKIKKTIDLVHQNGMGTGFCLDDVDDPVKILYQLNKVAIDGATSGKENRPVGNIAALGANHPKIKEFIYSKSAKNQKNKEWKFNISVSVDKDFMKKVTNKIPIIDKKKKINSAKQVFKMIVEAAHQCADPGLIFIDRLNHDNPTPKIGEYMTVAPCGEVGLAKGEFCQFAYINLGKFYDKKLKGKINYKKLKETVSAITRFLDDALEISIERSDSSETKHIMSHKRKIGIGVCGFADLLAKLSLPYDSKKARKIAEEIMSFINYHSKLASVDLAKKRGSFLALKKIGESKYDDKISYLERKYQKHKTPLVNRRMWIDLSNKIKSERLLRNATTTALPPTGRSAQIIDASTGIEPFFSLHNYSGRINEELHSTLKKSGFSDDVISQISKKGKVGKVRSISAKIRSIYKTALEIDYKSHLLMTAAFQKHVDESISKTINMPSTCQMKDIENAFILAYRLNLKGITIYRSGSKKIEPRKLAN